MTTGRKIRYGVYFLFICLLAAICLLPGGRIAFRDKIIGLFPDPSPSIIALPADPAEMGKVHGSEFKYSIKLLCKLYLEPIVKGSKHQNHYKNAKAVFDKIDPRWSAEINAIAENSGTDPQALMLANTFLDLGVNTFGCRQLIVGKPGHLLHAHNLDWDNLGGIGNYMVTIFKTAANKDRFATVYLGFPGMIGALDIINDKGIALSFNQVGFSKCKTDMPIFIKMRAIAEKCSSFEAAQKEILSIPSGMPFCIGLSDAKSGKSAVFERDQSMIVNQRNPVDGIIAADNNLWYNIQMQGRCAVDNTARELNPSNIEDFKKILRNQKVLMNCNIYSLIFDYKNNVFHLASGKIPAANGNYRTYQLFEQPAPAAISGTITPK